MRSCSWRAFRFTLVAACLVINFSQSTGSFADEKRSLDQQALDRLLSPPLGLPKVSLPADNPPTIEKIALGRKLFFDRRLSKNGTMSCGMCHISEQGFTNNELATPIGVHGRSVKRNAPTILNTAYQRRLFLDGRSATLEEQAVMPLLADNEMGNESEQVLLAKIAELEDYQGLFEAAFSGAASLSRIGIAIASWERTMLAANSPFDRWYYGHEQSLTPDQQRGFELFQEKARCVQCHSIGEETALFTDQAFHDTGIGYLRSVRSKQEQGDGHDRDRTRQDRIGRAKLRGPSGRSAARRSRTLRSHRTAPRPMAISNSLAA